MKTRISGSPLRSHPRAYEALADEMVTRADRIRGTLEDRQRGVARMQEILTVYERILREERLRA